MLKGSIDALHDGRCYGWAVDSKSPCAIEIEAFVARKARDENRAALVFRSAAGG